MNALYSQTCDSHPNWGMKSVRDERRKAKCGTKEALIEDDEKLDTGNQLEKWRRGKGRLEEALGRI